MSFTVWPNKSSSVVEVVEATGGGGCVTVRRAEAVDGNIGGVAGLPRQRRGLPFIDGIWAHGDRSGWRLRRWRRWRRRWCCLFVAGAQHQNAGQSGDGCEYFQRLTFHVLPLHVDPPANPKSLQVQTKCFISNSSSVANYVR